MPITRIVDTEALIKLIIFVVNYDSSHGKFFEFDLVSNGKVVVKRGK